MRIDWTEKALRELDLAFEGLAEVNEEAALRWRSDVQRMMEMIEDHPRIGHYHRRDIDGEIREVLVGRYRIIYRLVPDVIEIRRIHHVRRDYDPQRIRDGFPPGGRAFVPA